MLWWKAFAFTLPVALMQTAPPQVTPPLPAHSSNYIAPPPRFMALEFHGDTAFSPSEREYIKDAAVRLSKQTRGLVSVVVKYGLDFTHDSLLEQLNNPRSGRNVLYRVTSSAALVKDWDAKNADRRGLLGLTGAYTVTGGTRIDLVADRLVSPEVYVCVAMHEFLHAAGMSHLPHSHEPQGVMADTIRVDRPFLTLTPEDLAEIHSKLGNK